jgi:HEAT repeat protein
VADRGDRRATRALADGARAAGDVHLRLSATYALGKLGDPAAVPPLRELLQGPDGAVAYYAYDALARLARTGVPEAKSILSSYRGQHPQSPLPPPGP